MSSSVRFFSRACVLASVLSTFVSCKDSDDFFSTDERKNPVSNSNRFDFSTTQNVDLIVDYSAFNAKIPVFFSVYNVNPFVNENNLGEYIDENVAPLFAGYTDENGKFDETVVLPAYAKRLHIVTGNFLVGLRRNVVQVSNGIARAIVENPLADAQQTRANRAPFRVAGAGTSTNDLSQMKHLYQKSDGTQLYKPWSTPLGTWNSASGRPDYLLDNNDQALIDKGLVFTEEQITGLFGTACDALNSGTNLKEQYRAASDLTLIKDSEVSITALGSSTCWNSSLGYYYYTGDAPTNKMDLNIIMLFPNTQDGLWPRGNYPNNKYNGNIGAVRGDVIQLKYYPNIANGDFSGETTVFPAGTKIGFILKCNSWGQRGNDYAVNGSGYATVIDVWASSTDGLSAAYETEKKKFKSKEFKNPNGEARSAKFAYTAPDGKKYVVVSFEDCIDDKDYDDLMFALNPADAFDFGKTAEIESRRVETKAVYAFEDLWPRAGDFDMNDMIIDCKHVLEFYTHQDGSNKLNKEYFYLTPMHNYITQQNGLAVDVQSSNIATIYVNKLRPGETKYAKEPDKVHNKMYYYLSEFGWDSKEPRMWYLTDDITKEEGVTYVFEITYTKAVSKGQTTIRPFLWRKQDNGKQLEVHLPWVDPTGKADTSLFGTEDDRSNPAVKKSNGQKMYYVGESIFPFAFHLEGASVDVFKNTILKRENESKRIDTFFPEFLEWSKSDGKTNQDWYLHPSE